MLEGTRTQAGSALAACNMFPADFDCRLCAIESVPNGKSYLGVSALFAAIAG